MYCINCKKEIDDGIRFCTKCGAPQNTPGEYLPAPYAPQQEKANDKTHLNTFSLVGITLVSLGLSMPVLAGGLTVIAFGTALSAAGYNCTQKTTKDTVLSIIGMALGCLCLLFYES